MVKSDLRMLALYMYFNWTGIWGGETLSLTLLYIRLYVYLYMGAVKRDDSFSHITCLTVFRTLCFSLTWLR